jgi:competence ComEA-like helix-hairpin-helix protein
MKGPGTRGWGLAAALAALMVARGLAQAPAPPSPESRFPDGPGRTALFKVCGNCHGPESVLGQLKTHDEWRKTLDEMASNGAEGSDEEWSQIQAYLDKHYSLIFVNKANATDLASTFDVAPAIGDAIVKRRTEHGAYKSVDDLKQVPGLAANTIDARKDRLIF